MKFHLLDVPIGATAILVWLADLVPHATSFLALVAALGGAVLVWLRVCLTWREWRARRRRRGDK